MSNFKTIQNKLQKFIRKFYINDLIKGAILFFTLGFLYFILTLFIEYFLWLKPFARTLLFWLFILVELSLLVFYIFIPIFKLVGLKDGISETEASKIIGKYFPEVNDKLLNMLQLKQIRENSELIEASIEQKSLELKPIPFVNAVDLSKNKKYIRYAVIPLLVLILLYITGSVNLFNDSFKRVLNHNLQFEPPVPFYFLVKNKTLNVVEGKSFTLEIETIGNTIPDEAKIYFSDENYYLVNEGNGKFLYTFSNISKPISFNLIANNIVSKDYKINVISTPVVANFKMVLKYPKYTSKTIEVIQNTGNVLVPEGTIISWQVETHQTNNLLFKSLNEADESFQNVSSNYFSFQKRIFESINYSISTSNDVLKNFETLNFAIDVVSDEFPKINVATDIDSISRGPVQFIGQISDDYGLKGLQLVYYDKMQPELRKSHLIDINQSSTYSDFYYIFPEGIAISDGINYEMYFEVFDNDAVNGSKKSKSKVFNYYNKTVDEIREELSKEEKEILANISKSLERSKISKNDLKRISDELQKKASLNWNDKKKLDEFLKRQNQYDKMFEEQSNKLQENLLDQPLIEALKEKKIDLEKRLEETKKMQEHKKMLDELKELSDKLKKEDLIDKLNELTQKNKRNEQSLERILELTKRFYVEQKANQIKDKLYELSQRQNELTKLNNDDNGIQKQQELRNDFNKVKNDFNELDKQNNDLKRSMDFPNTEMEQKDIDQFIDEALKSLKNLDNQQATKYQKGASKKMKELADSMNISLSASEGEMIDENIDDLRKIVENLIEFSFQQEDLMNHVSVVNNSHPEFAKYLKRQHVLKEYFEHIDDSLYVLSLRLVKLGSSIQNEVSDAYFNIDASLKNFSENNVEQGMANQQFVVTASNNLANSLGDLLESLMNSSPSLGKGKGNSQDFSLPDIIKKQGDLLKKIKDGNKQNDGFGKKNGEDNGELNGDGAEQSSFDLYEIYKQQTLLKDALKKLLPKSAETISGNDVLKDMEDLEKELLDQGFSEEAIKKMEQLNYELLKLESAKNEQGEDTNRKSDANFNDFEIQNIEKLKLQNRYFNYNEILNRQSLPLRSIYKKKVQEYFNRKDQ